VYYCFFYLLYLIYNFCTNDWRVFGIPSIHIIWKRFQKLYLRMCWIKIFTSLYLPPPSPVCMSPVCGNWIVRTWGTLLACDLYNLTSTTGSWSQNETASVEFRMVNSTNRHPYILIWGRIVWIQSQNLLPTTHSPSNGSLPLFNCFNFNKKKFVLTCPWLKEDRGIQIWRQMLQLTSHFLCRNCWKICFLLFGNYWKKR